MAVPDTTEAVASLRLSLIRISRRLDRQVGADGFTTTELSVLAAVARKGPLGLSELAGYEGINPTMLSRVLGRLEAAGLIERQADSADRRAVQVSATRSGARLRERLLSERTALLNERLGELPPELLDSIMNAVPALEVLAASLAPQS